MKSSVASRSKNRDGVGAAVRGPAVFVSSLGWWIFSLWTASELQDNHSNLVAILILSLFAVPLVLSPTYGMYLIARRRRPWAGVAVFAAIVLAAVVFLVAVVDPIAKQL